MTHVKLNDVNNRKDYISVDGKTAISAYGEIFNIGDVVRHESEGEDEATISGFFLDKNTMDVLAQTDLGAARICFIYKPETKTAL